MGISDILIPIGLRKTTGIRTYVRTSNIGLLIVPAFAVGSTVAQVPSAVDIPAFAVHPAVADVPAIVGFPVALLSAVSAAYAVHPAVADVPAAVGVMLLLSTLLLPWFLLLLTFCFC